MGGRGDIGRGVCIHGMCACTSVTCEKMYCAWKRDDRWGGGGRVGMVDSRCTDRCDRTDSRTVRAG